MRGRYIADLMRQPWAILPSYMPTVSRVLMRIEAGAEMSPEDLKAVAEGQVAREARSKGPSYAGDVAVIGCYGVLTQRGSYDEMSQSTTSSARLAATVRAAAADGSVGAIVLDIDSPGGSVYGTEELGNAIFEARGSKPIAAVANSLAASAAYWAGCQAGEFYAAPGAEVGSIGVYAMHVDQSEALKKEGVAVSYISAGKFKVEGNPYEPLGDDARMAAQGTIDGYYDSFVRAVSRGRGTSLKAVKEGMGQGRVLLPDHAKAEGMIDGTATLAEVVAKLQSRIKRSSSSSSSRARREREISISELEG